MKRRRGNPNWGKESCVEMPVVPSQWELLLKRLHISEDDQPRILCSMKVRQFARLRCNTRYVPEWLLDAMGLILNTDDVYLTISRDLEKYVPRAEQ